MYVLSFKPAIELYGGHDPSAALFKDGKLVFAVEEERYTRKKHAVETFPKNAIQACLDSENIELSEIDRIILPYKPELGNKLFRYNVKQSLASGESYLIKGYLLEEELKEYLKRKSHPDFLVRKNLRQIGTPLPEIRRKSHHKCHAASAFYPTDFEEALVVTVDGRGEYDSTVVWYGDRTGLERCKTFKYPNSLGLFYGAVTEFLGYRRFNGEGKVMGLAPYGDSNEKIEESIKDKIDISADYDVTKITNNGIHGSVECLESLFDRPSKDEPTNFTDWEKDLAYVTQSILEEVMVNIIKKYINKVDGKNVCLAGGVALNCKMNKIIEESKYVNNLFIQPVSHDAGLSLGGGYLCSSPSKTPAMKDVYWGPEYSNNIEPVLEESKLEYKKVDDVADVTAKHLANGELVGWFQGKMEMGPRALGNRSILADPRSIVSRDKVNKNVKHREEWRPFSPSLKEDAIDEYLVNATSSPFMIKTYDVKEKKQDEIPAVLHPGDSTTRPQTVNKEQNPRYYNLLSAFEDRTGVPVLLNTSFNDHAEPIINKPIEAIKDFYGIGLDMLVLDDYILEK